MNDINPIPIKELASRKLSPDDTIIYKHHYIIPDYQRGYRWDEINVTTLLNDIHEFKENCTDNKQSYCLQPIVVSKSHTNDNVVYWEVIDGQQRLITLYLILNYLKLYTGGSYTITFDKRELSNTFLVELTQNGIFDHSKPDFHFMSQAYGIIKKWFEGKETDPAYKLGFSLNLLERVKVLFYEVQCGSQEEKQVIFERLNIGKIPLTDSELIKALFLSKIQGDLNQREINLRQAEISNEWQRIELELRKPEKWLFLNIQEEYSSHIELLFDLIADQREKKNYSTYLYFEKRIKEGSADVSNPKQRKIREAEITDGIWREIKQKFAIINSWFCNNSPHTRPTLYHYVGYLLATGHKNIKNLIAKSSSDKDVFMKWLKDSIIESISGCDLTSLSYENNYQAIKRILLLFNVLSCDKISRGNNNRFPFDRYGEIEQHKFSCGWSIEHIHAQNSQEPIKSIKAIRAWIDVTLKSLRNITHIDKEEQENSIELDTVIEQLKEYQVTLSQGEDIDINEFNELKDFLINIFDSESIHEISNLALLTKQDNSILNNAIFPVKRDYIINLEREGQFIPPCTRNVFLKFYSESNSQPYYWSKDDKEQYFDAIQKIITEFVNKEA